MEWQDHTVVVDGVGNMVVILVRISMIITCVDGLVTHDRKFKAGTLEAKLHTIMFE